MLNFGGKRKGNEIAINNKGEFSVFCDIILFSKDEVYEEMKVVLNNEKNTKKKREELMDESIFKYNIICDMQNTLADIEEKGMESNETIYIPVAGEEEAELFSMYAAKMLSNFMEKGFSPKDKDYKEKANTITYSGTLFEKLSDIANKNKKETI